MSLFDHLEFAGHERVLFARDEGCGLAAIIAVHDSRRGPTIGGCRMWPFASDDDALADVLRLSRAMTLKNAMADLPHGGGKSVVIGDPRTLKSAELWHAFGRAVEDLRGLYNVAEDVNVGPLDLAQVAATSPHVLGLEGQGGGNPAPFTADGVFRGLRVVASEALGRNELGGVRCAVQGLGAVGMDLARRLAAAGARLVVTDLDPKRCASAERELGATVVDADGIIEAEADLFVPCALGGVLNDETIPKLRCAAVAGSANNQLATAADGIRLHERGILYAPDYVINAGGVIAIADELAPGGFEHDRVERKLGIIERRLHEIVERSRGEGIAPSAIADRMALEILAAS